MDFVLNVDDLTVPSSTKSILKDCFSPAVINGASEVKIEFTKISPSTMEKISITAKYEVDFFLVQDVLENLLSKVDFLGYQLSFANEEISEEQFEEIIEKELTYEDYSLAKIQEQMISIFPLIKNQSRVSSDLFSMLLKCDIDSTTKALSDLVIIQKNQEIIGDKA